MTMSEKGAEPTVHLLCNSHLDPVWLWEWPEGAGEALALARTVCDLCEEFEGFVFNRNEVQFYQWIEEYDPDLFRRIGALVEAGRWHVMGGWFLQPDCNLPSGESFVRQILVGKRYFREKFGVEPTTAANLDSFGHTRGLVQILARSGYDSYLFCRPKLHESSLPEAEITWVGYDGSEVTAALAESHYNSAPGEAAEKIRGWMEKEEGKVVRQVPWGVGDHGGGPSRRDIRAITELMDEGTGTRILHSTPEAFVADLRARGGPLPRHEGDLNPWAVGCYTSAMRLKRTHRRLENAFFLAEAMATTAWAQGRMDYPVEELTGALRALLANQFHDILGGTSIPSGEEAALEELGHGLTLARRVQTRAFFALAAGEEPGGEGGHPILVYNPHPFPLRTLVECEVQPAWPDREDQHGIPTVMCRSRRLPAQAEQQESNINEDHRKRVVFVATLKPGSMNRFDCSFRKVRKRPPPRARIRNGGLRFRNGELDVAVNARTGLLDRLWIRGVDYLAAGGLRPLVMRDNADPWGMTVSSFRRAAGRFSLMSQAAAARFAGVDGERLPAVRVIEDGPVRTVVEALFGFGGSAICQRYKLPREGVHVEVDLRVLWQEKNRMLKLSIPTPWPGARVMGQVAYGKEAFPGNGEEMVAQSWLVVPGGEGGSVARPGGSEPALTVINDCTYGFDFRGGELRLSLLRAPAHAAHPTGPGRPILHQDRFTPRMDQGEHRFRFWLTGGPAPEQIAAASREAQARNQVPFSLAYRPPAGGESALSGPALSDKAIQLTAFKKAEEGQDLILRLFEPTGRARQTTLTVPCAGVTTRVKMGPFELKTLRVDSATGAVREVNLLEE
jgi:alpha-mannosidase